MLEDELVPDHLPDLFSDLLILANQMAWWAGAHALLEHAAIRLREILPPRQEQVFDLPRRIANPKIAVIQTGDRSDWDSGLG